MEGMWLAACVLHARRGLLHARTAGHCCRPRARIDTQTDTGYGKTEIRVIRHPLVFGKQGREGWRCERKGQETMNIWTVNDTPVMNVNCIHCCFMNTGAISDAGSWWGDGTKVKSLPPSPAASDVEVGICPTGPQQDRHNSTHLLCAHTFELPRSKAARTVEGACIKANPELMDFPYSPLSLGLDFLFGMNLGSPWETLCP